MSRYIRATIGFLAFLGLIGCGDGGQINLILGLGFALVLWVCARPRQKKIQYIGRREQHESSQRGTRRYHPAHDRPAVRDTGSIRDHAVYVGAGQE